MVTGPGPSYAPLLEMDADQVRHALGDHVVLGLEVARNAAGKMRPGGTLIFMGGTGGRKISRELGLVSAATAALPPFAAALALELAPVRVNLIAAGFVDTPLSASLLGEGLDARREELRATLPIGRVVEAGRRRRARRSPHDQYRGHGRDLRHRRRPAVRLRLADNTQGERTPAMRSDIQPGATFPDYELPDHESVPKAQRAAGRRSPDPHAGARPLLPEGASAAREAGPPRSRGATSPRRAAGPRRRRCAPRRACRSHPERRRRSRPAAAARSCPIARRCTPGRMCARRR